MADRKEILIILYTLSLSSSMLVSGYISPRISRQGREGLDSLNAASTSSSCYFLYTANRLSLVFIYRNNETHTQEQGKCVVGQTVILIIHTLANLWCSRIRLKKVSRRLSLMRRYIPDSNQRFRVNAQLGRCVFMNLSKVRSFSWADKLLSIRVRRPRDCEQHFYGVALFA